MDKIRKQKEDVAQKSANLNDISIDSSVSELSSAENANKTGEQQQQQQQQQQTSLFTLTQENNLDPDDETLASEHDTTLSSELDSIPSQDTEKKLIKGIMMSSHNVSSLNEIENHRASLNAKTISANNRRQQTEKCSSALDLSHASKDPMVAGPSELFRKNDLKLMIELKNKKLLEQQTELERKLKELELKEAEIERAARNKPASLISAGAGADSGNDHNYCSESIDNSSILTQSNSLKEPPPSSDDLKRIEYQRSLLISIDKARAAKLSDELSSATSSSGGCFVEPIEEQRKREILKRFGIEAQLNCSKKPPPSTSSSSQQLNAAQSDDKHTIYSSDSGFASGSNCYYNMSYRAALGSVKKPINLAVEKLNDEITNKRFGFNAGSILNAQQQQDLVSYLSGDIDEDEYKRRLSNGSFNLSGFSFNKSGSQLEQKQQLSRLFGLEFFDSSNNMSDVRDSSIEHMIGWSLNSTRQQQQQQQQHEKLNTQSSASTNSNDTSNDEDDDASFKTRDKVESDDTIETLGEDEEEDENGQALIMSLLNSRQAAKALPRPVELSSIEFMRQSIQEQLEAVRKQKEQLQVQSSKLAPPIRAHRLMGECNLHELSTIKEVDTPISERNLKLTSKGLNRSMGNVNDVSSALSSSSLENVTQLSDNWGNATSQFSKANQQQFGLGNFCFNCFVLIMVKKASFF